MPPGSGWLSVAEVQAGPTRAARGLVWSAAAVAVTLVVAVGLFVVSQVFRALGESFCTSETRLPATAGTVSGPTFVDPVHLRCDYGDAGSRVFFAVWPAVELGLVVGAVAVGVGVAVWFARLLTTTASEARVSGKVDKA
jgi:hypothetical protein